MHKSRNEFERFEEAAKEITPGVDYKSTLTRRLIVNERQWSLMVMPLRSLNATDKFRVSAFYAIVDKLETEMSRRGSTGI